MATKSKSRTVGNRHPADSYDEILDQDSRTGPDYLRQRPGWDAGIEPIPVERYYSQDYFDLEVKHMWSRVWQMACREEHIAKPGDIFLYENVGQSVIVVRTKTGEVKAYYNSCPHRARRLIDSHCNRPELWCPFHGMSWNLDGTQKSNPLPWDFPQWNDAKIGLPEVRVDLWGGYIFVNFDQAAKPLADYLGPIPEHFAPFEPEKRYVAVHLQKIVAANWKVTADAFIESFHGPATHPQLLKGLGDLNTQYDTLTEHVTRMCAAQAVPSPVLNPRPSEAEISDYMQSRGSKRTVFKGGNAPLPDGITARAFFAERMREGLQDVTGRSYAEASDAEMTDTIVYNLFPNFSPWLGYNPNLCYNWRPYKLDPNKSIMDVYIIAPHVEGKENPPPAETIFLGENDSFRSLEEDIGLLSVVLDQDMANLPYVQIGLRASGTRDLAFAHYSEASLRQRNKLIQQYIDDGLAHN
jgi:phenylpropionate dioxygenase-like ring-hydroxylating dioxygenase large terminal subunit